MTFVFLLAFVIIFITFLFFIPMRFGIRYEKRMQHTKLHIYVSVFGILIRIPIRSKSEKKPKQKTQKQALTFETFKKNVESFGEICEVSKDKLLSMLSYARKHLNCKEIDFKICFGFDDAAKTGIMTGAVWTSGTLLLKLIDSLIGIKSINMNVYPDFNEKKFDIYLKTILIMKPFRFIIILREIIETINYIKRKIN